MESEKAVLACDSAELLARLAQAPRSRRMVCSPDMSSRDRQVAGSMLGNAAMEMPFFRMKQDLLRIRPALPQEPVSLATAWYCSLVLEMERFHAICTNAVHSLHLYDRSCPGDATMAQWQKLKCSWLVFRTHVCLPGNREATLARNLCFVS